MIDYVSPKSKAQLTRQNQFLVSAGGESYPVVDGIPRFVPTDNYAAAFGLQWKKFSKTQLDSHSKLPVSARRLEHALGTPLDTVRHKNILEAGCGAGRFTELLVKHGAYVHSFDLSQAVEANKENIGEQPNYQICQASIYEIPYPDDAFDVVICLGVLQHTPSPEKSIAELWKKVKPGGMLVIDHYKLKLSYYLKMKPVWRFFIRRMEPGRAMMVVKRLHEIFFPLHWKWRNQKMLRKILYRYSPLTDHLDDFPELDAATQSEWSVLDSYDSLTDHYKHLRTEGQIRKILEALKAKNISVGPGGTGIEARAEK